MSPESPVGAVPDSSGDRPKRREWPAALTVGVVAAVIAAVIQRVWAGSFQVPLRYSGDVNQVMLAVKGITEGGWYYENLRVGAPFGLELYDFPDGGQVQFAGFKMVGWLTGGDVGLTLNLTYLLGFLAVGAVGYWVLRKLDVARPWAMALGILYALLPYHFVRSVSHHYLSLYLAAPLGILLAVRQAQGSAAFVVERDGRRGLGVPWRHPDTRVALVAGALIGLTGAYYAIFTGLLLIAVATITFLADRDRLRVASTLLVGGVVGVTLLISLTPTLAYRVAHGANPEAGVRIYSDIERYALKPVHMLLPIAGHRVELFRGPMVQATTGVPRTEGGQNLGLVGSVGLIALLAAGMVALLGSGDRPTRRTRLLFVLAAGMIITASVGGFGALLGIFGFTQLRAWNRIVVFIGFVIFVAVGTWLSGWWRDRSSRVAWLLAAALVLVGAYDQTSPVTDSAALSRETEWIDDAAFIGEIEALLPDGAMVYQLPYMRFPENGGVERMADYDLLKGYLHSEDLRWSYAAMRGRVPEWQPALLAQDIAAVVDGLVAVGFQGLYIDRFGYADSAAALELSLRVHLGLDPVVSGNGRLLFFDLRPAAFELQSRLDEFEIAEMARRVLMVEELPGE